MPATTPLRSLSGIQFPKRSPTVPCDESGPVGQQAVGWEVEEQPLPPQATGDGREEVAKIQITDVDGKKDTAFTHMDDLDPEREGLPKANHTVMVQEAVEVLALPPKPVLKIPELTLIYWILKMLATTLGETFADMISMTFDIGYWQTTLIFLSAFVVTLLPQLLVRRYCVPLFWAVILSTSLAGTAISDTLDRTLKLGYIRGSGMLLGILAGVFLLWGLCRLPFSVTGPMSRPQECFYWLAILVSNTLGTALGDCVSDDGGLGFAYSAALFGGLIVFVGIISFFAVRLRVLGFWAAFVLTRPFGAAFGDFLTKDPAKGGCGLGTFDASSILGGLLAGFLVFHIWAEHFHKKIVIEDVSTKSGRLCKTCTWLWGV